MTTALPTFRAPEFRDLARAAQAQGWDVYRRRNGHVAAVNPANGATVSLSATAPGSAAHGLANARQALIRAGLVLDRGSRRAPRLRQEVPVEVHTVSEVPVANRPGAQRQGGRFATVHREEVEVAGLAVRLSRRADDVWMASIPDTSKVQGRRAWYSSVGREDVLSKVAASMAAEEDQAVAESGARLADVHLPEDAQAVQEVLNGGPLGAWHVVQANPEDYPHAAALDRLDASLAPALAALEAAGKADAAGLLRAEVTRSEVEEELLALYRRVMRGD